MRRFAVALSLAIVCVTGAWADKPVWQDTDATQQATYLSNRRALVGRHCVANKLINEVGVGSWNTDLNNLTDEDLDNYALFNKVVDATVAVNPIVSIRDLDNHYASGTEAGFILQANDGNLLSLDVIKEFSIAFYLEGSLVGTQPVTTGQDVSVLGLSLLTIPGSEDSELELAAVAPGEFDEIALMPAGGVDATVATATKIRYAFVGKKQQHTITNSAMQAYAQQHGRLNYTLHQEPANIGNRLIDDDLTNLGVEWGVIGIGASITAKVSAQIDRDDPDQSQAFKKGAIVGFNYSQAALLDLSVAPVIQIKLYKGEWVEKTVMGVTTHEWEETEVQTETVNGTVLALNLGKGGNQNATIIANEDFSAARFTIITGVNLDLGGTVVYYGFVCDTPDAKHECDIKLSADANICDTENSYQLVNDGTVAVNWAIEQQPTGAHAAVDSNGRLTGMTVNGTYVVSGTSQVDGICKQEVAITRGLDGIESACDQPVYNSGIDGDPTYYLSDADYITDSDGGVLLSVNQEIADSENILNPQTGDFATYSGGLTLIDNVGLIGVRKSNGKFSDGTGNAHRIGFVIETHSIGLDLTALQAFNIRTYNNGTQTYQSVVTESNVIGLSLIGSQKNQKVRLAITVPADVPFDEFVLWKTGVLGVDVSKVRIYYSFDEELTAGESPTVTRCLDPLGCDSQLVSPTTGATLNGSQTRNIGVISVAQVIDNLSFLIDDDVNTAVTIANSVNLGDGLVIAVDMGHVYNSNQPVGVIIDNSTYLASLNVASWLTIETFRNGVSTGDRQSDWKVAGLNVIGYGDKDFLMMHPTHEYDEVRITIAGVIQALDFINLYGMFVTSDRDGDGIADCRDENSCAEELVLNEDAVVLQKSHESYTNANLVLHRTLYNNVWNPIVLPVNMTGLQLRNAFGNGMKVAAPKSLSVITSERNYSGTMYDVTSSCIEFEDVTEDMDDEYVIRKGEFYLLMPEAAITPDIPEGETYTSVDENEGTINGPIYFIPGVDYVQQDLDIEPLSLKAESTTPSGAPRRAPGEDTEVVFNGTYVNLDGDTNDVIPAKSYAYRSDGSLWEVKDNERQMKGFRFYIENNTDNIVTYGFDEGDGVVITGIIGVRDDALERTTDPNVYTIDGRLLGRMVNIDNLPAGIYIINGKKVLVR